MEKQQEPKLDPAWCSIQDSYELVKILGFGVFGQVVLAQQKATGQFFAIKLIRNIFKSSYQSKQVLREICILRRLSKLKSNVYTTKLYDIIVPCSSPSEFEHFRNIFLVMEHVEFDLRGVLSSSALANFNEEHVTTILYNILCCMNFLHTANIVHRDIKPANILMDGGCAIKICDFGLARTLPNQLTQVINSKKLETDASILNCDQTNTSFKPETVPAQLKQTEKPVKMSEPTRKNSHRSTVASRLKSDQLDRQQRRRQLSNYVMSRWYRAPEIILQETEYDYTADNWSIGCILCELLLFSRNQGSVTPPTTSETIMFPGTSCFPLSPCEHANDSANIVSTGDQMMQIITLLGRPSASDKSFITDEAAINYIEQLSQAVSESQLSGYFKDVNPELLSILKNLLELNPYYRKPVSELLRNPIFDKIRVETLEKPAEGILNLNVDKMDAYDYNKQTDFIMTEIGAYRKAILKEIKRIKQDAGLTQKSTQQSMQ